MMKIALTLASAALLFTSGCALVHDKVLVGTSTILGFEVAQNPASQMYQIRFGYARAEVALVPTNGVDVLTELQFKNVTGQGGLYQRMAVGSTAVKQSMFMFAKNSDGTLDPKTAEIVSRAVNNIPASGADGSAAKLPLATAYQTAADKTPYDTAAQSLGYLSFDMFLLNTTLNVEQVAAMRTALAAAGVTLP